MLTCSHSAWCAFPHRCRRPPPLSRWCLWSWEDRWRTEPIWKTSPKMCHSVGTVRFWLCSTTLTLIWDSDLGWIVPTTPTLIWGAEPMSWLWLYSMIPPTVWGSDPILPVLTLIWFFKHFSSLYSSEPNVKFWHIFFLFLTLIWGSDHIRFGE